MNSPSRGLGGAREGGREAGLNELTLKSGAPARKRRRPRSVLLGAKAAAAAAAAAGKSERASEVPRPLER